MAFTKPARTVHREDADARAAAWRPTTRPSGPTVAVGQRLLSPLSGARFLVVAATDGASVPRLDGVELTTCGPMPCGLARPASSAPAPGPANVTYVLRGGLQYADAEDSIRLLCTRPGPGILTQGNDSMRPVQRSCSAIDVTAPQVPSPCRWPRNARAARPD